ncbi:MAG TPA: hypothetical protein VH560_07510 [Polyangia bacterium]|jgi:hypothetical protein|nr:hypothetical protein [Polyangia bacterium]
MTIKRQSETRAKISKIRAQLFFVYVRTVRATHGARAGDPFLNQRSSMRFRETIEQHFRRAHVSKRFRRRARAEAREMGTRAIERRAIARASTENARAKCRGSMMSRRIARDRATHAAKITDRAPERGEKGHEAPSPDAREKVKLTDGASRESEAEHPLYASGRGGAFDGAFDTARGECY